MTKRKKHILFDLGLVFFFLIYVLYIYKYPGIVQPNELVELTSQLKGKPKYYPLTGDNEPSIVFQLKSNSSTYVIKSCPLQQVSIDKFLNINLLDTVEISIKRDISLLEKINSKIEIFQLKDISTNHIFFSIEQINSCEKGAWKHLFIVTLFLIGAVLFSFFTRVGDTVSDC